MKRYLLITFLITLCISSFASGKKVRCKGTYQYQYSTSISYDEAKPRAIEYAEAKALEETFGTFVSVQSFIELSNDGTDRFNQLGKTLVKGKIVKHNSTPTVSAPKFFDNMQWVEVMVDFDAVAVDYPPTEFVAKTLRNGTDDRYEDTNFAADDKFYLSFRSPKAGYVAVFYEDQRSVVCMLPYDYDDNKPFAVEKGKRYLWFDLDGYRYHLSCDGDREFNLVHIIYSPNDRFINGDLMREMSCLQFHEWLDLRRNIDTEMQAEQIIIKVSQRKN